MIIYFLRHANAGKKRANPKQDEKRPLDEQGIEQSRFIGRALAILDTQVDAIFSSPLKRASQTAAIIANELGFDGKIQIEKSLRPDAEYQAFRALLQKNSGLECIMVVGHNPTLTEFCSLLLTSGLQDNSVDLKKGAIARVEFNGKKSAVLQWCITPKIAKMFYARESERSLPSTARK